VLHNGHPAADLEVRLDDDRVFTDQAGRFGFPRVAAGQGEDARDLVVLADRKPPGQDEWTLLTRSIDVRAGEVVELELAIETSAVRGLVTRAGDARPLAHRTISFFAVKESPEAMRWWNIETDEAGRFEVPQAVAGAYWVFDEAEEYAFAGSHPVTLRAGAGIEEVEIVMAPAWTVSGQVEVEGGERGGVEGGLVRFEETRTGRPRFAEINADGSFSLDGLAAGTFTVRLYTEQGSDHADLTVVVGRNREDLRLQFKKRGG
jgi:hypothetical protein